MSKIIFCWGLNAVTVRLFFVLGFPSSGTSCTAGILSCNGFYNSHNASTFEAPEAAKATSTLDHDHWHPPKNGPKPEDIERAHYWFDKYRADAAFGNFENAVMKYPGQPCWVPEFFEGYDIDIILVHRTPEDHAESIARRWPTVKHPRQTAMRCSLQIKRLRHDYGWPVWEFGANADVRKLSRIVGHPLSVPYFDAERIAS